MDIWAWVSDLYDELEENGQGRLARLLYQIPDDLHENRVERLEASVLEAVQSARSLKHPWMEVFFRHWGLRNRLSNYLEGEKALEEAISLMDFSHREESKDCPQSICVTQDLASCYGNVDGPGWVAERIAVVDETLARISPSRNCWDCLSREKADALKDDNRIAEALSYLIEQEEAIIKNGSTASIMLLQTQADYLQELGRFDEALAKLELIEQTMENEQSRGTRLTKALIEALIYVKQNQFDKASEVLPKFLDLQPVYYPKWAAVIYRLATDGFKDRNTWQLAAIFQKMIKHFQDMGSHRLTADMAIYQAKLAIKRNSAMMTRHAIKILEETLPKLRKQDEIKLQLAQLKLELASINLQTSDIDAHSPDELIKLIHNDEHSDPEKYIDALQKMQALHPYHNELTDLLAHALWACDINDDAIKLLETQFANYPEDNFLVLNTLTRFLNQTNNDVRLVELAKEVEKTYPIHQLYIQCLLDYKAEAWESLRENASKAYTLDETNDIFLQYQVLALTRLKRFGEAIPVQQLFIKSLPEEAQNNAKWDLLTFAASAEQWAIYREVAKELNLELNEPSSPDNLVVEEEGNWVWVKFIDQDVESYHLAQRTGPTTVRIKSVAGPNEIQHANDWVAIDAMMLEAPPEDEEEKEHFMPTFQAVHVIKPGNFKSIIVDGPRPTSRELERIYEKFDELGWLYWRRSGDEYQIMNPENDEFIDGLYFFIGVPNEVSDIDVFKQLKEFTADFKHPLCWLQLAKKVNLDTEHHQQLAEQYGL
ncbi:tetratricopeptide repeat protein [Thorsellia anophelis]|uniref:Tetratricopeptide repeat-containing protein n=1 Tax=Thorsellia anophelis DSM 18579 TaxID=1123402 RepID=A0A1I0F9H8_9GAMM|nr:hypothetical protein [Thorsellia anophelis]SET54575.1 hypothetical protein SAMN02583745_02690 [Thorsellia anophelis DSM 18579]